MAAVYPAGPEPMIKQETRSDADMYNGICGENTRFDKTGSVHYLGMIIVRY
jgi:hypothetical protein